MKRNQLLLDADIVHIEALRVTPGGIETVALQLDHRSTQEEAKKERETQVQIEAVAFGPIAREIAALKPGSRYAFKGFLAAKAATRNTPVLHITAFKPIA